MNLIKILIVITVCMFFHSTLAIPGKKHEYVGNRVCETCHGDDTIGNQHALWLTSPHAKAVQTLKTEKALSIAGSIKIKEPASDVKCLRCHTTGGGRVNKTRDEGVGCEACHGPGADYYKASAHVNYSNRESAYVNAVKNGMYPILGIEQLKKREKLCLHCHTAERPCMPTDREGIRKQIITIQVIDKLVKGDIKLKHQLRR